MAFHCRFTDALCISSDLFAYFQSFSLKNYDKAQQAFKIHHRLHPAAQLTEYDKRYLYEILNWENICNICLIYQNIYLKSIFTIAWLIYCWKKLWPLKRCKMWKEDCRLHLPVNWCALYLDNIDLGDRDMSNCQCDGDGLLFQVMRYWWFWTHATANPVTTVSNGSGATIWTKLT